MRIGSAAALFIVLVSAAQADDLKAAYARADNLGKLAENRVFNLKLTPHWFGSTSLWFRTDGKDATKQFMVANTTTGALAPLFDHAKLADALAKASGQAVDARKLPFSQVETNDKSVSFVAFDKKWTVDLASYGISANGPGTPPPAEQVAPDEDSESLSLPAPPPSPLLFGQRPNRRQNDSPDGNWTWSVQGGQIVIRAKSGGEPITLTKEGGFTDAEWSPNSEFLVGKRLLPGDHKTVSIIQSSPPGGGRAVVKTRMYDLPGDELDRYELYVLGVADRSDRKVEIDPILGGGQPWASPPDLAWRKDGERFAVDLIQRGNQRFRVMQVNTKSAKVTTLVDEQEKTFFDTTAVISRFVEKSDELLWRSERDRWGHLYLLDASTGAVKNQITKGNWVVRTIEFVDEDKRQLVFSANGMNSAEDPYFIHYYRVNFDGSGLVPLTPAVGNHVAVFSPDHKTLVDTYSQVNAAPIHELRDAETGRLVVELARADVADFLKTGVRAPEVFVAKGRDGKTDIWGIVCRPTNYNPKKKYPVIENIYAGPHDSFVPKSYTPVLRMQRLAELGFIVVQIDGMGTRNRGKDFHDYCWKNLADAGFPDRILWMKALAQKDKAVDITRVGVYGTSAGGQNSTAAMLFHPEFYKVAVSSCGCHDNRMDKFWWNEQWMGVVGPHYAEQSNITNAAKLQGKLLLMVGEMDTNVPPETTLRLVDALIKANKEFDMLMLPGLDHTDGGVYGERKRRDFFVRWLSGQTPPDWNQK